MRVWDTSKNQTPESIRERQHASIETGPARVGSKSWINIMINAPSPDVVYCLTYAEAMNGFASASMSLVSESARAFFLARCTNIWSIIAFTSIEEGTMSHHRGEYATWRNGRYKTMHMR